MGDWFTIGLVVLYVGAMACYAASGNWCKALYFLGATILTAALLRMK